MGIFSSPPPVAAPPILETFSIQKLFEHYSQDSTPLITHDRNTEKATFDQQSQTMCVSGRAQYYTGGLSSIDYGDAAITLGLDASGKNLQATLKLDLAESFVAAAGGVRTLEFPLSVDVEKYTAANLGSAVYSSLVKDLNTSLMKQFVELRNLFTLGRALSQVPEFNAVEFRIEPNPEGGLKLQTYVDPNLPSADREVIIAVAGPALVGCTPKDMLAFQDGGGLEAPAILPNNGGQKLDISTSLEALARMAYDVSSNLGQLTTRPNLKDFVLSELSDEIVVARELALASTRHQFESKLTLATVATEDSGLRVAADGSFQSGLQSLSKILLPGASHRSPASGLMEQLSWTTLSTSVFETTPSKFEVRLTTSAPRAPSTTADSPDAEIEYDQYSWKTKIELDPSKCNLAQSKAEFENQLELAQRRFSLTSAVLLSLKDALPPQHFALSILPPASDLTGMPEISVYARESNKTVLVRISDQRWGTLEFQGGLEHNGEPVPIVELSDSFIDVPSRNRKNVVAVIESLRDAFAHQGVENLNRVLPLNDEAREFRQQQLAHRFRLARV